MAPIRSKLMELSYSDPKFRIRLTGYADTVIIDSGTQQTISAIRFGGYPEVVRALSDAIYGGASVELKQDDTTLYLKCRPKGYRRLLSHDGIRVCCVSTFWHSSSMNCSAAKRPAGCTALLMRPRISVAGSSSPLMHQSCAVRMKHWQPRKEGESYDTAR